MNSFKVHEEIRRLYEDTITFAREYEFRERPDVLYSTGKPGPTDEDRKELIQRANAALDSLKATDGPFRIARASRTSQTPQGLGLSLSWHEWIIEHCLVLLHAKLVAPWPRDDVFEQPVHASFLRELAEEANLAAEMLPALSDTAHSDDFRSVCWFGSNYSFTANQAPAVKLLWENWQRGTPDVGDETLLVAIDHESPPGRLANVFRDNPAWGAMIVHGETKGSHLLSRKPVNAS